MREGRRNKRLGGAGLPPTGNGFAGDGLPDEPLPAALPGASAPALPTPPPASGPDPYAALLDDEEEPRA